MKHAGPVMAVFGLLLVMLANASRGDEADAKVFRSQVAPLLVRHCVRCHHGADAKGQLDLSRQAGLLAGGDSGEVVVAGQPDESLLLDYVSGDQPEMPQNGPPLSAEEVAVLHRWIAAGAHWPAGVILEEDRFNWWSLRPLAQVRIPDLAPRDKAWARNAVDAFILRKLRQHNLRPSAEADRRTLIRRLYFDLLGLPPAPEEMEAFVASPDPLAYEKLVDRLLSSPQYGERWARHWLDVVHYGDTHGYDKDKLRPNAWPYRDYVIRAFNRDKPYVRFIEEQLAGDVLYGDTTDGVVAMGFIAAGPWDFIGHVEVPETKIDGKIARNLDRDDMVSTTINALVSLTVQCARCHDHKFDPVTQEDYYSLQAVFAALDRADRPYELSGEVAKRRRQLTAQREALLAAKSLLDAEVRRLGGADLAEIDGHIERLNQRKDVAAKSAAFGYHSRIESRPDNAKWVQVDLGRPTPIKQIVYVGCHDDFNQIGAGFGFPPRYKIEVSNDPGFQQDVTLVVDHTRSDVSNPGVTPQSVSLDPLTARYVRVTATRLALRQNDYIFALAELSVLTPSGANAAFGATVTALDSIEAPVRWQRKNLVDGYYFGAKQDPHALRELAELRARRASLLQRLTPESVQRQLKAHTADLQDVSDRLARLPSPGRVYAGTVHTGSGNFRGSGGTPREIRVLVRGDVRSPGPLVGPGTVAVFPELPSRFPLSPQQAEGQRRVALVRWLVAPQNALTWRSIVNRIWQYHMGRGIVDSPNDFGRMGSLPTHPELLDWLAVEFRDQGSLKRLHRLILTSSVYRQTSEGNEALARIDGSNRYYWRMNRRRLDAESIRDTVLLVSGKLDGRMYGPGFRDFVLEKPEHSPHYEYHKHDPDDPLTHRRSIYRFIVRSQPEPFMETLDCADPSLMVARRNETLTALQALALMNNKFMLRMTQHFAERLKADGDLPAQIDRAYRLAIGRSPSPEELQQLSDYAAQFGLANACRIILNLNEFVFVD